MKIYANQLPEQLNQQIANVYFLVGNEPLLLEESRQALRQKSRSLGFELKERFSLDNQLNWNDLFDACQSMSLFSSQKLIEIDCQGANFSAVTAKALLELSELINQDVILALFIDKYSAANEKSKWYQALMSKGAVNVNCQTPDIKRLPQFIQMRARPLGLYLDNEGTTLLAHWFEGNLLALSQGLDLLKLIYPDGKLTAPRINEALAQNNHFTVFQWVDSLLEGRANRSQYILKQLAQEGTEPVILLRSLQKELFLLARLKQASLSKPIGQVFAAERIWQSKQAGYLQALKRLNTQVLTQCLQGLSQIEISAKTEYNSDSWIKLEQLTLLLCLPERHSLISSKL